MATLVRRALAEVCTVPMLLVIIIIIVIIITSSHTYLFVSSL